MSDLVLECYQEFLFQFCVCSAQKTSYCVVTRTGNLQRFCHFFSVWYEYFLCASFRNEPSALQWQQYRAILYFWADPLCSSHRITTEICKAPTLQLKAEIEYVTEWVTATLHSTFWIYIGAVIFPSWAITAFHLRYVVMWTRNQWLCCNMNRTANLWPLCCDMNRKPMIMLQPNKATIC